MKKEFFIEKEPYTKGGKSFNSHVVKGTLLGKEVKATLVPPDPGGYQLLEVIIGDKAKYPLTVTPFSMTTESGDVISGNTYSVEATDADGTVYSIKLQPLKKSDKAILKALIK